MSETQGRPETAPTDLFGQPDDLNPTPEPETAATGPESSANEAPEPDEETENRDFLAWIAETAARTATETTLATIGMMQQQAPQQHAPDASSNPFKAAADEAARLNPGASPGVVQTPFGPLPEWASVWIPVLEYYGPKIMRSDFVGRLVRGQVRDSEAWRAILSDESLQHKVTHVLRQKLGATAADAMIRSLVGGK